MPQKGGTLCTITLTTNSAKNEIKMRLTYPQYQLLKKIGEETQKYANYAIQPILVVTVDNEDE